jgi:3',5'-cyclic AMP phosphodiesterase CpdA
MRFLTISDTHVREASPSDRGWALIMKARALVREEKVGLVLFGGDLAEPSTGMLDPALGLLASFDVPVLWVVGNNDLEALETTRLSRYAEIAQRRAWDASVRRDPRGGLNIHVLDTGPYGRGGVAFVGNYVGYDGSLYHDPASPHHGELLQQLDAIHDDAGLDTRPLSLHQQCLAKLRADISLIPPEMAKVVCTHTVPDGRFLKYGHSTKFDDYNVGMGWTDTFIGTVPGLRYQFCGHTHRSQTIERDGLPPIINISGAEQPRVFSF